MNAASFAPLKTIISLTDTSPTEILSGLTVKVWGFSVTELSGAAKTVTLRSADGATNYMTVAVAANQTLVHNIKWVADKGLEVVASAGNASVTVFHSQAGA